MAVRTTSGCSIVPRSTGVRRYALEMFPPLGYYQQAFYRVSDHSMLMAGGLNDDQSPAEYYSAFDYYSLDLASFVWTQHSTSGYDGLENPALQNRFRHCMACDDDSGAIYLVGGEVNYGQGFVVDCWELNGSTWVQKPSPPEAVQDSVAIFHNGQLIVSCEDGNFLFFDGDNWTTTTPANVPAFFWHSLTLTDDGRLFVCSSDNDSLVDARFFVYAVNGVVAGEGTGPRIIESYGLYACPDRLPTSTGVFTKIYEFGPTCGVCKFAVLNDRMVITEGLAKPPLVWGGCMADDASDWMHPKAVLVSQDGQTFYDVSNWVCDADPDTVAQVGGIRPWGYIAICTDMPLVQGFYLDIKTPNEGVAGITSNTFQAPPAAITGADDITRQDLRNGIITDWAPSAGNTGSFVQKHYFVSTGGGVPVSQYNGQSTQVVLPCTATGNPFAVGTQVTISGTANYNGTFTLLAGSNSSQMVISANYVAEALTDAAQFLQANTYITLGTGNQCPDVLPGVLVEGSSEVMITAVTGDGAHVGTTETPGLVTLSAALPAGPISAIYGIQVTANGATINSEYQNTSSEIDNTLSGSTPLAGYSIRMVIPGSSITQDADHVQITLKNAAVSPPLPPVAPGWAAVAWKLRQAIKWKAVSIVPRDGATANGTTAPTPVTFNNGRAASTLGTSYGGTFTSDKIPLNVTSGQDLLLILDLDWSYNSVWDGRQFRSGELPSVVGTSYIKDYGWGNAGASADQQIVDGFTEVPFIYALSQFVGTDILAISPKDNVAVTTDLLQFNTNQYEAVDSVTVQENKPGTSTIFHAVSFDGRQTFSVFLNSAWREIVRQDNGTWQYIDGADAWQNASANSLLEALRQALAIPANQMTGAQLGQVTSTEWSSPNGFVPHITPTIDFAFRLEADQSDLTKLPILQSYTLTYETNGQAASIIEGWKDGAWTKGKGWTDNTIGGGNRLGKAGTIMYAGAQPFQADYHVLDQIPGFWYRLKTNGTSPLCAITEIRYKAPCQPLSNIGDGQPDVGAVILQMVSTGASPQDISVAMADNTLTSLASAAIPMTETDYLYIGYATRFDEVEITPYADSGDTIFTNNQEASVLSAEYWNGEAWQSLTINDRTIGTNNNTFAEKGRISWTIPSDWRTSIPFDAFFSRGYWVRFRASAALTPTVALSELRVYGVPDSLKKYKFASTFGNRIALANRPDAPDQVDISRQFEEYGFIGQDAGSFRLGGMDQISSVIPAWDGLLVGKTGTFHFLEEGAGDFKTVEAGRHVPISAQVVVKAPMGGFDYGDRYALFFLNRYGAFVSTGLHTDSIFNTSRGKTISDVLNWWDSSTTPRLALDYLHLACGEYWPAKNWIIWAVPMIFLGSGPQPSNNALIVYDLTLGAWLPPFVFPFGIAALCTAYHYNTDDPQRLGDMGLYAGDYEGRVIRLFPPGVTSDLGSTISAWAETGWLDFGAPGYSKLLRMLSLCGKSEKDPITVNMFSDGDTCVPKVAEFQNLSSLGSQSFALEQESNNLQGRFFKFRIELSAASEVHGLQVATSLVREWGAL